ncbi:27614_t:CDS:2 [Gigaspora margarita]|uniref:27614_t:CDS:1 n=1 Tax=Gigaspora margarita TaxID=4874 RepID=A0ABM8W3D7_GIGMA|nr:27614_t:CDS:2 [Gigaspora margarita]
MIDTNSAPQFIIELVRRCWDADPSKRPTAQELKKQFDETSFQNQLEIMANNFQVIKSSEAAEMYPGK